MQVENHKEEVPFSHYEGLFRNLDPQAALERLPSAAFDGKRFTLTLLGRTYDITWPDYAISVRDGGCLPGLPTQTFLLRCLLEAREVADPGSWKTFREMPWGGTVHPALYRPLFDPGSLHLRPPAAFLPGSL